jgi:hypothetical protein
VSPEVWANAAPLIAAAAAAMVPPLPIAWPNEDPGPRPSPPAPWLDIELQAQSTYAYELGGNIWRENGTIWLHVMIPVGSGMTQGLTIRKTLSVAFRQVQGDSGLEGLYYDPDHSMDPAVGTDDGIYRRLSLLCRYHFEDKLN